jgi:acyl carrier protein
MNQNQVDKLQKLIIKYTRKDILSPNASLSANLDIDGDDAFEFIKEYEREFNVDISSFKYKEYFGPEGLVTPLTIIWRLIVGGKKSKELTFKDLIDGIETGVLDPK